MTAPVIIRVGVAAEIHGWDCLPERVRNDIERALTWPNPRHAAEARRGEAKSPEYLYGFHWMAARESMAVPRAFAGETMRTLDRHMVEYRVEDRAPEVPGGVVGWNGMEGLYPYQQKALDDRNGGGLRNVGRHGALVGPLGAGKKVTACARIADSGRPAVVVVAKKTALYQWAEVARRFLVWKGDGDGELVGLLGDRHEEMGRPVTIATAQSLHQRYPLDGTGMLIIDAADQMPAKFIRRAVEGIPSRETLALQTGTRRRDRLESYAAAWLGKAFVPLSVSRQWAGLGGLSPELEIIQTGYTPTDGAEWGKLISAMAADGARQALVARYVQRESAEREARVVVLSPSREMLNGIRERLFERAAVMVDGSTGQAEMEKIAGRWDRGKLQIVLVTDRSLEKLAFRRAADCVVVAGPPSFGEAQAQMIQRLLLAGAKEGARPKIIDYVDNEKRLAGSFRRRVKFYRAMGAR